jgi:hypothetical protein
MSASFNSSSHFFPTLAALKHIACIYSRNKRKEAKKEEEENIRGFFIAQPSS